MDWRERAQTHTSVLYKHATKTTQEAATQMPIGRRTDTEPLRGAHLDP